MPAVAPPPVRTHTVFHVTHWKAGSQWVRSILKLAAPKRFIQPTPHPDRPFGGEAVVDGAIYTPVYASHAQFRSAVPDDDDNHRVFVVIRDPRDTLVSWYFSHMYSHKPDEPTVLESRQELRELPKAEGLALMTRKHMQEVMLIQREWLASGARLFRYEDLWADQQAGFREIFDFCGMNVPRVRRQYIVRRQCFTLRTFWRLGRPNPRSHFRKGTPGDWQNHFDEDLKKLFKERYGETLVKAGYERDDRW